MPIYNPNTAPSVILSVVSKTTTYTATTSDDVILVDTSGGAWTLTLYAASGNSGKVLRVIKTTSDTNALTIDGNASETINGFANIKLNYQFDEVTLVCDGTNWNIISQIIAPTVQTFTSSSGTYNTPNGVKYLKVKLVGGGGGGSGSGTSAGAGGNGADTTFGSSLLTASAGAQGLAGSVSTGGTGGQGGGFTVNSPALKVFGVVGGNGQGGGIAAVGTAFAGGQGGTSFLGGSGSGFGATNGATGSTANAAANSGSGGGGGGIFNVNLANGTGGGAGGYVEAIIPSPSTSYAYSIGTGGASGGAGTTGFAGGAGAAGIVIVEEYYQ